MNDFPFRSVVWAIDTLEQLDFQKNALRIMTAISKLPSVEIYPVHVQNYFLPEGGALTTYEEAYQALSEKRMQELKATSATANLQDGKILINRDGVVRQAVERLLEYAIEKRADVIVASTHSRRGIEKFVMGSFAETLLLQSKIPLITVNPKARASDKISKVLMPTSFDPKLRIAADKVLEFCASFGASLTMFYKEPFIPMLEASQELIRLLLAEAEVRREEAERLRALANQYGVPLEFKMDTVPGDVEEAIVTHAAKDGIDLIAMVSQTSGRVPLLLGSICRKVIREADCPVWTFKLGD